jgi:hypothetical protein
VASVGNALDSDSEMSVCQMHAAVIVCLRTSGFAGAASAYEASAVEEDPGGHDPPDILVVRAGGPSEFMERTFAGWDFQPHMVELLELKASLARRRAERRAHNDAVAG